MTSEAANRCRAIHARLLVALVPAYRREGASLRPCARPTRDGPVLVTAGALANSPYGLGQRERPNPPPLRAGPDGSQAVLEAFATHPRGSRL